MGAVARVERAEDLELERLEGSSRRLVEPDAGATLLAFVKHECPTCGLIAPFVERLHRRYGGSAVRVVGVAQDEPADARAFAAEGGWTFPVLLDRAPYRAGRAYRLDAVPTLVLVERDGGVALTLPGFLRSGLEALAADLARRSGREARPLFVETDSVPEIRPG